MVNNCMKILNQLDELNLDAAAKTGGGHCSIATGSGAKRMRNLQAKTKNSGPHSWNCASAQNCYGLRMKRCSICRGICIEETCTEDLAAVEAEVEQIDEQVGSTLQTKRPARAVNLLPAHSARIEHRHEPESCQCDQCGRTCQDRRRHHRATGCQLPSSCSPPHPSAICLP